MKPGKSILYTIDANGANMDYLHKNNATIAAHAAFISSQASAGKKISLEDISAAAKKRARLQRGFLEESKVNKAVARDLMNSKPMYTVE